MGGTPPTFGHDCAGTIFAADGKLTKANGQTVGSFGPLLRYTVDYSEPEVQVIDAALIKAKSQQSQHTGQVADYPNLQCWVPRPWVQLHYSAAGAVVPVFECI